MNELQVTVSVLIIHYFYVFLFFPGRHFNSRRIGFGAWEAYTQYKNQISAKYLVVHEKNVNNLRK